MRLLNSEAVLWARWFALFGILPVIVRLDVIRITFDKLGLSPGLAICLLPAVVVTRPIEIHIGDLTAN